MGEGRREGINAPSLWLSPTRGERTRKGEGLQHDTKGEIPMTKRSTPGIAGGAFRFKLIGTDYLLSQVC
jgi:hypothetical protein